MSPSQIVGVQYVHVSSSWRYCAVPTVYTLSTSGFQMQLCSTELPLRIIKCPCILGKMLRDLYNLLRRVRMLKLLE